MNKVITVKNLVRHYTMGENIIKAVDNICFDVEQGSFTIILGASGAGKSTILNILGGMDKPTSGEVYVSGQNIAKYNTKQLTKYRRETIGFVFQFYNLMPNLTVLENVELARQICKNPLDAGRTLGHVGLSERKNNFPSQISGGEQQRVAIARALAKNPDILLCDEPTGALDHKTGKSIFMLLCKIYRENRKTIIVVTHNNAIAPIADRVIRLKSGVIERIEDNTNPLPAESLEE